MCLQKVNQMRHNWLNSSNIVKKTRLPLSLQKKWLAPEVSKTLAQEVGAKVETIYTIESKEDDKTYLERMDDNLTQNLRKFAITFYE